jgi:hypothetical protein
MNVNQITIIGLGELFERYWPRPVEQFKQMGDSAWAAQLEGFHELLGRREQRHVSDACKRIWQAYGPGKMPVPKNLLAAVYKAEDDEKHRAAVQKQQNLDRLAESEPSQVECNLPNRGMPPLNAAAWAALKAKNYAVYVECMRQAIDQGQFNHEARNAMHIRLDKIEQRLLRPVYA